ncbi:MAG: ROK family protein [Thermodesulfovibrionales bacterium]|nr:ROK family protein [Thermodesulfovibrionales bacterium]
MNKKYAIGIDLGGTNLRVALVTRDGEIIRKMKEPTSEKILDSIFRIAGSLFSDEIAGIGLGVAGLVDREGGRIVISPNLPAVEGINLVNEMREKFRVPVFIENDANAAALGEKWIGAGKEFSNLVLFTLGTGIGGGIIQDKKLLNVAAEIGHMTINTDGEKCFCGNYGCLESYASARAMLSKLVSALEKGRESILKELCGGNFYKLTAEDIYRAALGGDSLARETLREAGRYLGIGIANIINVMSPEAIILAGGLTGAWDIYIQEAIKEASKRAFKELFGAVEIIPSLLGEDAGIIGSAGLVFENDPFEVIF